MITVDYSIQATKKLLGDQAKAMAKASKKGEAQVNITLMCFVFDVVFPSFSFSPPFSFSLFLPPSFSLPSFSLSSPFSFSLFLPLSFYLPFSLSLSLLPPLFQVKELEAAHKAQLDDLTKSQKDQIKSSERQSKMEASCIPDCAFY